VTIEKVQADIAAATMPLAVDGAAAAAGNATPVADPDTPSPVHGDLGHVSESSGPDAEMIEGA
jgi:hypothetical protein